MRTKKGIITSAKMTDTVTVTVHRSIFHELYKKRYRMSKKFLADSKGMDLGVGDEVVITECRPLSKRKHFKVTKIIKQAPRVSEMADEKDVTGVMDGSSTGIDEKIERMEKNKKNSSKSSQPSSTSESSQ